MTLLPVRIASIAVRLPDRVINNDWFGTHYPTQLARISEGALARLWKPGADGPHLFDEAMVPYIQDPFRGAVLRHWLADGESTVSLEEDAARRALAAAGGDVDVIVDSAFFPDQVDVGNAAFLAQRLAFAGPAINLESACSGGLMGLLTAASFIASGLYRRALVVVSCNYSRLCRPDDSLGWGNGDGAAALVVERADSGGLLAADARSTHKTCGAIVSTMVVEDGQPVIRMRAERHASAALRDNSEQMVACCTKALADAQLSVADVDVVAANCPTAWYANFLANSLGLPRERVMNVHPQTANVGPVLWMAALERAVREGRLPAGKTALLHSIGSVSTAAACVLRQDQDIRLG